MTSLPIATAILTAIGFALISLMIIASGQVFECIREIALNTRAAVSERGEWRGWGVCHPQDSHPEQSCHRDPVQCRGDRDRDALPEVRPPWDPP